jgi:predicted nucleotidyltransferase
MTNILHDISKTIDPLSVEILETVDLVAKELGDPYFLVGAMARDILLHHVHGANVQRATEDYDFAIEVKDWATFEGFKAKLIQNGFKEDRQAQRVVKGTLKIDLIPFGPIARDGVQIDWPPDGNFTMNVVGFEEALRWLEYYRIRNEPPLDVPVVSTIGLTLLKLLAWTDRAADKRRKDALDLKYIFSNYELDPKILDQVYQDEKSLEQYGWDPTLASVHILGESVRAIANEASTQLIDEFHQGKLKGININRLIDEMCSRNGDDAEFQRNEQLLSAFLNGYDPGK